MIKFLIFMFLPELLQWIGKHIHARIMMAIDPPKFKRGQVIAATKNKGSLYFYSRVKKVSAAKREYLLHNLQTGAEGWVSIGHIDGIYQLIPDYDTPLAAAMREKDE